MSEDRLPACLSGPQGWTVHRPPSFVDCPGRSRWFARIPPFSRGDDRPLSLVQLFSPHHLFLAGGAKKPRTRTTTRTSILESRAPSWVRNRRFFARKIVENRILTSSSISARCSRCRWGGRSERLETGKRRSRQTRQVYPTSGFWRDQLRLERRHAVQRVHGPTVTQGSTVQANCLSR
jgi:hypothetical protein